MERKIDYDRGVIIRQIATTGMEVFMYRKEPGVYYTAHGNEVNPALARLAGFDVDRQVAMREHQRRALIASTQIAKELEVDNGIGKKVVLDEEAGFRLVDLGKGRYWIEDEHGPLNKGTVLTLQMARTVFDACIGDVRKPQAKPDSGVSPGTRANAGATVAPKGV
jgi:hypothetical protein